MGRPGPAVTASDAGTGKPQGHLSAPETTAKASSRPWPRAGTPRARCGSCRTWRAGSCAAALETQMRDQARDRHAAGATWTNPDRLVLSTEAGSPLGPSDVRRALQPIDDAAGIGHLHPHRLRHAPAGLLPGRRSTRRHRRHPRAPIRHRHRGHLPPSARAHTHRPPRRNDDTVRHPTPEVAAAQPASMISHQAVFMRSSRSGRGRPRGRGAPCRWCRCR